MCMDFLAVAAIHMDNRASKSPRLLSRHFHSIPTPRFPALPVSTMATISRATADLRAVLKMESQRLDTRRFRMVGRVQMHRGRCRANTRATG